MTKQQTIDLLKAQLDICRQERDSLKEWKKVREGSMDATTAMLGEENSRLWYIVRSMIGDKTLEQKQNEFFDGRRNRRAPFEQPSF